MASSPSRDKIGDTFPEKQEEPRIISSSNWEINNDRNFDDCVSTIALSQAQDKTNLEDVVTFDTCVALKLDPSGESCMVEFKVLNSFKIVRIAVVSEASVLEFFKQSGEYATTAFAEFVDEFQDHVVYFAEARIEPPSAEASIKFTRIKSKGPTMWIYGIKLVINGVGMENSQQMVNPDLIGDLSCKGVQSDLSDTVKRFIESHTLDGHSTLRSDLLSYSDDLRKLGQKSKFGAPNSNGHPTDPSSHDLENTDSKTESVRLGSTNLKMYIDNRLSDLERQLMHKIETCHQDISEKLDEVLRLIRKNDAEH